MNTRWVLVVGPFSLCVIHNEGLCSENINRLLGPLIIVKVIKTLYPCLLDYSDYYTN
jgi:hypothetical protein